MSFKHHHHQQQDTEEKNKQQLLLNYCYTHRHSSLLLIPYSPIVNYINHNYTSPNAYIRWSTKKLHHQKEWEDYTVEQVLQEKHAGLALEFVALKDIHPNEEIFINYGQSWEQAWNTHVKEWKPSSRANTYISPSVLNREAKKVKTKEEQYYNPYAWNIRITCYIHPDTFRRHDVTMLKGKFGYMYQWVYGEELFDHPTYARSCDILSRDGDGDNEEEKEDVYTARIYYNDRQTSSYVIGGIPRRAIEFVDGFQETDQHLENGFRHAIEIPDEIFPKMWMDLKKEEEEEEGLYEENDEEYDGFVCNEESDWNGSCHLRDDYYIPRPNNNGQCGLYLAESSIPNAGFGLYTGLNLPAHTTIPYPDVVFNIIDEERNKGLQQRKQFGIHVENNAQFKDAIHTRRYWLPNSYVWKSRMTDSQYEAESVTSLIPGPGMLCNSYPNLYNIEMDAVSVDAAGLHRRLDPGAGAFSTFHNLTFHANKDIPAGMELFLEYGDTWFVNRESTFGLIPLNDDYVLADQILEKFFKMIGEHVNTTLAQDLWSMVGQDFIQSERVKNAMPKNLEDAINARKKGTALHSLPNAVRSIDWLEENGFCMDNIRTGRSRIKQAGRGAFATKFMKKGEVIVPSPTLQILRSDLEMYDEGVEDARPEHIHLVGNQLLLNYCYGHKDSSMLLIPSAPGVNFINHHDQKANAYIRWSNSSFHQSDWLNKSVDEVIDKFKSGLVFEFVALKDISPGEEIYIDYGERWEEAWRTHVREWKPPTQADDYSSAYELNQKYKNSIIRTMDEQKENPYPSNVGIICFFTDTQDQGERKQGPFGEQIQWIPGANYQFMDESRPCKILDRREFDEETDLGLYTVKVMWGEEEKIIVSEIPRRAIAFVDRMYTGDQLLQKAFRHEIDLPNELFPEEWKDLKKKSNDAGDDSCRLYMAESSIPNSGLGMYAAEDLPRQHELFNPDIVIQVVDRTRHNYLRKSFDGEEDKGKDKWLMERYSWGMQNVRSHHEAEEVEVIIPGYGMLANSHPGHVNIGLHGGVKIDSAGLRRGSDPGAGAFSTHYGLPWRSEADIPAGMELIANYGDDHGKGREDLSSVPGRTDYEQADVILEKYRQSVNGNIHTRTAQDLWKMTYNSIENDRVKSVIPENLEDAMKAEKQGTAKYALPNAIRTKEWLRENGQCLDNIRPDLSTIKQAGRGAFATRFLKSGDVVAPAPLAHLSADNLVECTIRNDRGNYVHCNSYQLLLNYCFGHRHSSLLLYPHAPVVNFINHNSESPNAYIKWSNKSHHKSEWEKLTVEEVLQEEHTGLALEFVALRDISAGEEVFIDYGRNWEEAWNEHVDEWEPNPNDASYIPPSEVNEEYIVRTAEEQQSEPYPWNVMTTCLIGYYGGKYNGPFGIQYPWIKIATLFEYSYYERECTILARESLDEYPPSSIRSLRNDVYTAKLTMEGEEVVISHIPRQAIGFVDRMYYGDQFIPNAFRHEMEIPDDIFPEAWKNVLHD